MWEKWELQYHWGAWGVVADKGTAMNLAMTRRAYKEKDERLSEYL